jgi:hypothetical protein
MPGASKLTRKVSNLNANWVAGTEGTDGRFEVLIVTDDGQQHVLAPSPAAVRDHVAAEEVDPLAQIARLL